MGQSAAPYAEVGLRLGISEGAVKVAAHRLQKRHKALVRAEITDTVESSEDVAAEIRELLANLG